MSKTYRNVRYREQHRHPKTFNQIAQNSKLRSDLQDNNLNVNVRHNAKCKNSLAYLPSAYDDINHSSYFGKNKLKGNLLCKEQIMHNYRWTHPIRDAIDFKYTRIGSCWYRCKLINKHYEISIITLLNRNWITFMDIPLLFKAYDGIKYGDYQRSYSGDYPIWINFQGIHIKQSKVLIKFIKTLIEYVNKNKIDLIIINVSKKIKYYFNKYNDSRIHIRKKQ